MIGFHYGMGGGAVGLLRSGLLTGGVLGLRIVTQALTLVLLTRLLGPLVFGSFAAAASLAVVMGILPNFGAGFVMMARASRGSAAVDDVWRYAWPMTVMLGVVLLGIYLPLAQLLGGEYALPWLLLLGLAVTELVLMPMCSMLSFVLQAHDRVPVSQLVQLIPLGLRTLAVIPCFAFEGAERLQMYVLLQSVATVGGVVAGVSITSSMVALSWRPRLASWSEIKEGGSYSVMHIVAANPSELDKMVAVRLVGAFDAGIYVAGTRVMGAVVTPVLAMLLAAQPRLFRYADMELLHLRRLIGKLVLYAMGWGLACCVLLTVSGNWLVKLFGNSFSGIESMMGWLAIVAIPLSLRLTAGAVLVAIGRPLARVGFELCGIGMLVVGMILFAPTWGVKGMTAALFVSESSMVLTGWWMIRNWWLHYCSATS